MYTLQPPSHEEPGLTALRTICGAGGAGARGGIGWLVRLHAQLYSGLLYLGPTHVLGAAFLDRLKQEQHQAGTFRPKISQGNSLAAGVFPPTSSGTAFLDRRKQKSTACATSSGLMVPWPAAARKGRGRMGARLGPSWAAALGLCSEAWAVQHVHARLHPAHGACLSPTPVLLKHVIQTLQQMQAAPGRQQASNQGRKHKCSRCKAIMQHRHTHSGCRSSPQTRSGTRCRARCPPPACHGAQCSVQGLSQLSSWLAPAGRGVSQTLASLKVQVAAAEGQQLQLVL